MRFSGISWARSSGVRMIDMYARLVEQIEDPPGRVDDLVSLAGEQVDPLDARVALTSSLLPFAPPVAVVGGEDQPSVEDLGLAYADIHRDEGPLAETDEGVAAQLHAPTELLAQRPQPCGRRRSLAAIQLLAHPRAPPPRSSGPLGHTIQPNSRATCPHFVQSCLGVAARGRAGRQEHRPSPAPPRRR